MNPSVYRAMRQLQAEHWWFRGRRDILRSLIAAIKLPSASKILEAGCGSGGNIALLQEFGEVSAFELDEQARIACVQDTGIACQKGALPNDNPFADSRHYDLVVALDVIEHIREDVESIRSLAGCIAPGGALLITVPAYQWLFGIHDLTHHHKRRYNLRQINAVVLAAGLRVERSGYFNTLLSPLIFAARIWARIAHRDADNDLKMPRRGLNTALFRIFRSERRIAQTGMFPFGISAFVIARRRQE